jgi:hypothetical protein
LPNARREIRVVIGRARGRVDPCPLFEFLEGQAAGHDQTLLISHLIPFAIEQNSPVPGLALHAFEGIDLRGAVVGDGVMPLRVVVQLVGHANVVEKQRARELWRRGGAVQVKIFSVAIICAHAHQVAFVAHDGDECELAETSQQCRIGLAALLTCFDGEGNRGFSAHVEAENSMCDQRRSPIIHEEVQAVDLV